MSRFLNWRAAIKAFAVAVVFASSLYTVFLVGPALERQFFPVLDKLNIVRMSPTDNRTSIEVSFEKFRECQYIGIMWMKRIQLVHAEHLEQVPLQVIRLQNDAGSPTRPTGFHYAGPWIIDIPYNQIRSDSVVDVYHQCHPFWVTRTRVYP